jgi:enamine deaminase RidA (YjgF/YER057c/UK114 family)
MWSRANLSNGFWRIPAGRGTALQSPAITVLFVAGLANPDFLAEIDAIAVVPL